MRKFLTPIAILILILSESFSFAAEIRRANLDEAETSFTNAYLYMMNRDYWNAQTDLDQALKYNTYLVDYYLLTALNQNSMGNSPESLRALNSYLEVRTQDPSAPRILRSLEEQANIIDMIINTMPFPVNWRLSRTDVQNYWETGYRRPLSITGMGKIKALGELVCISDTFGSKIYIRPGINGKSPTPIFAGRPRPFREVNVPHPVISIPFGDGSFKVVNSFGEIYTFENLNQHEDPISADHYGDLISKNITDAEMISSNLFAISDPVSRNIVFYRLSDLEPMYIWTPPLIPGELLFEPVAVERYADWLAIADRANSRIYIFNITSHNYFAINKIKFPRDLLWSPLGELFVLTEEGTIKIFMVDFGTRNAAENKMNNPWENFNNIWALFHSPEGEMLCLDTGASGILKAIMTPPREGDDAFLGIYRPSVMTQDKRESFIINATLSSPFKSYMHRTGLISQTAWNDRTMRASAIWQEKKDFDGLLIYRLNSLPRGQLLSSKLRPAVIREGDNIKNILASYWLLHRETLTNIIIDASVRFTSEELKTLLQFCLLNGLELDIWANVVPSLALTRASGYTGGKIIYGLNGLPELSAPGTNLQIYIPLPEELSSSGYPGRSMLAVYLDSGLIQSKSWMPLWPDMFETK